MNRRVTFIKIAQRELTEAAAWYDTQTPGLGDKLRDDVRAAVGRIARRPLIYPSVAEGVRRARLRGFP